MSNRFDDAIAIQSACNLSGVARALVRHIDQCREEKMDTDAIAGDPAIRLIVYQMAHLCKVADGFSEYDKVMDLCEAKSPARQAKVERFDKVLAMLQKRCTEDDINALNAHGLEIEFTRVLSKDPDQAIKGTVKLEYDARIELHSLSYQGENQERKGYQPMGLGFFGEARQEVKDYIAALRKSIAEITGFCGVSCTDDPGLF